MTSPQTLSSSSSSASSIHIRHRQCVRFILVEPSHPGNIGAVARAIKTMGFDQLVLVNPRLFPHLDATTRASGADDVLHNCQVVKSLDEAIADCEMVIGTSVRDRQITWPTATPKDTSKRIYEFIVNNINETSVGEKPVSVAILFGRERTGLENHELDNTQWQIRIPANKEYSSLNLASAVQIIAYELNCQFDEGWTAQEPLQHSSQKEVSEKKLNSGLAKRQSLATHEQMQGYYQHLEQTLLDLDFIKANPPTKLLRKINRLYNRANVSVEELHILRGILTATQNKLKK